MRNKWLSVMILIAVTAVLFSVMVLAALFENDSENTTAMSVAGVTAILAFMLGSAAIIEINQPKEIKISY